MRKVMGYWLVLLGIVNGLGMGLIIADTGAVAGRVTESRSLVGIADATVTAEPGGLSTTTDDDGYYTMINLSIGNYIMGASKIGYDSAVPRVVTVESGGTTTVNFSLGLISTPTPTPTVTPTQLPSSTPTPYPTFMDCPCLIEEGYVKDATTNKGIANAIVSNGKDLILETDTYGVFRLCDDSSSYYGTHTFTASANGYLPSLPQVVYFEYCVGISLTFELLPITTPTPTTTVTPMPICEINSIELSPKRLKLKREQSREVIITLEGESCVPEGKTVTATISKNGNRRVSISSTSEVTDENGQAKFTITAKNKIGNAKVTFETDNLKKSIIVKVK